MSEFEWDEQKNRQNQEKHQISFEEAIGAFLDENRVVYEDQKHSMEEERFFCIGKIGAAIITVRFTIRGQVVRIIRCRPVA